MASTINAKNTSTGVVITPDASGQLELQTVDTTRMTIDVNGNVGIGTTSPTAGYRLSLTGGVGLNLQNTGASDNTVVKYSNSSKNWYVGLRGDTSNIWAVADDSAFRMVVDGSGNVGIGTSSPTQRLQIYSSGATGGAIQVTNASTGASSTDGVLIGYDGSNDVIINNQEATQIKIYTSGVQQAGITAAGLFAFNSGYGSVATAYGCRAWVNFNGTGTVAIRASGNVSSITDNGVGIYTINFTNAMPDVNYAVCASGRYQTAGGSDDAPIVGVTGANFSTPTTSAVQIGVTTDTATGVDPNAVYVSVFR